MQRVAKATAFVDPGLLPKGQVRVAPLDGDNSDPANGLTVEPGLFAASASRVLQISDVRRGSVPFSTTLP
jgi:hypothetical protein